MCWDNQLPLEGTTQERNSLILPSLAGLWLQRQRLFLTSDPVLPSWPFGWILLLSSRHHHFVLNLSQQQAGTKFGFSLGAGFVGRAVTGRAQEQLHLRVGFPEGAPSFPAGTTAHVGIALYGVDNKSGHRHLDGDNAFHRNSLDVFQIATERSLGSIWRIRIWHDNKGGTWTGEGTWSIPSVT